jgi:hypothetical protein
MRPDKRRFVVNTTVIKRVVAGDPPKDERESASENESKPGSEAVAGSVGKVHRFFEHGSFQTLLGIVGGLAGTFLDGRYFAIVGIWISYSLFRSGALRGVSLWWKIPIHLFGVAFASLLLFYMGVQVNKSRPHTYTPEDYRRALVSGQQLPITRQITNIYNSYEHTPTKRGPEIDFTQLVGLSVDTEHHQLRWQSHALNTGTETARNVRIASAGIARKKSREAEDELFSTIESVVLKSGFAMSDLAPGPQFSRIDPLVADLPTEQDAGELRNGGKVLYIGRVETFADGDGNRYFSEQCAIYSFGSPDLGMCLGHNGTKLIERTK